MALATPNKNWVWHRLVVKDKSRNHSAEPDVPCASTKYIHGWDSYSSMYSIDIQDVLDGLCLGNGKIVSNGLESDVAYGYIQETESTPNFTPNPTDTPCPDDAYTVGYTTHWPVTWVQPDPPDGPWMSIEGTPDILDCVSTIGGSFSEDSPAGVPSKSTSLEYFANTPSGGGGTYGWTSGDDGYGHYTDRYLRSWGCWRAMKARLRHGTSPAPSPPDPSPFSDLPNTAFKVYGSSTSKDCEGNSIHCTIVGEVKEWKRIDSVWYETVAHSFSVPDDGSSPFTFVTRGDCEGLTVQTEYPDTPNDAPWGGGVVLKRPSQWIKGVGFSVEQIPEEAIVEYEGDIEPVIRWTDTHVDPLDEDSAVLIYNTTAWISITFDNIGQEERYITLTTKDCKTPCGKTVCTDPP